MRVAANSASGPVEPPPSRMDDFKQWLIANRDWLEPLGALVGIVVVVFPAALFHRPLIAFAGWLWQRRPRISFGKPGRGIPPTQLTIVPMAHGGHWQLGTWDRKPTMQATCRWHVTNVSGVSLKLLDVRPYRPRLTERWNASLSTMSDNDVVVPGDMVTLATSGSFSTRVYSLTWMMSPPPKHVAGQPLRVRMLLVDKFGNRHKTPWTELQPPSQPRPTGG
jgi:hypothetical protein